MKFRRALKKTGRGIKRFAKGFWRIRWAVLKVLLVVIGAALCIVPAIYLNTLLGYLPIFFYLLLLVLGGLYLLILRSSIRCSAENMDFSCPRNECRAFRLTLCNRSPLAAPVVVARFFMNNEYSGSGTDEEIPLVLAPFETREFPFEVQFSHLGRYSVGVSGLEVGGFLNLTRVKLPGGGVQHVEVTPLRHYPEQIALSELVETEDSRGRTSIARGGSDYNGMREYVIGDPVKSIHWKASAKLGGDTFMTKMTEMLGNSGVDILIDVAAPPWDGEDGACMYDTIVESALAVMLYAIEKNMDYSIRFYSRSSHECQVSPSSSEGFDQLVDELPGITDDETLYPLDELLEKAATDPYAQNNIVLCSARADAAIFRRLEEIQNARRHPAMIYVVPPGLNKREREDRVAAVSELEERNIPCHIISSVEELE